MAFRRSSARISARIILVGILLVCAGKPAQALDNGVDPANLGKGDWIYFLNAATNRLGGSVPAVTDIPSLMAFYKGQAFQFLVVKAGTGSTNFNNNQFNSNLVLAAHAAGLKIFGYTRSYGDDVPGEIELATRVYQSGADGFVIDAEAEWESSHLGASGPALAVQLCSGIKARFPTRFLGHAPFPIISSHKTFPFREFGLYCDTVMPQDYWKSIGVTPEYMAAWRAQEWRDWQNSLTGTDTNAIKPLAPIAQGWSPSAIEITTGAEIAAYANALKNEVNPVTPGGYHGISFWRADLHTNDMWPAMWAIDLRAPTLGMQPEVLTLAEGSNGTFSVMATGAPPFTYQWFFNGAAIPGATGAAYTITNAQGTNAGLYSAMVTNSTTAMLSSNGTLIVQEFILNVNASPGARSAVVSWQTRHPAGSQVEYGLAPSLGSLTRNDSAPKTNHAVLLAGLSAGSNYYYRVLSASDTNSYRSGVRSFSTPGPLVIDNPAAAYTGSWVLTSLSADKYGSDYRYVSGVAGAATATATFTPNLPSAGYYSVYIWYPQGSNRPTNAPVSLTYSGGILNFVLDQTSNGGRWIALATNLYMPRGAVCSVRVANNLGYTGKVVMADAVRFVYEPAQDRPVDVSVPGWWTQAYFGGPTDNTADPDGDGLPTWMEYLLGTDPTRAESRLDVKLQKLGPDTFQAVFSPAIADRVYQWQSRASLGEGGWTPLSNAVYSVNTAGQGVTTVTNVASQGLLRLKTDWAP